MSAWGWHDALPLRVDLAATRDLDILEADDDGAPSAAADGGPRVARQNLASDGRNVESPGELRRRLPSRRTYAAKHDVQPPVSDVARHPAANREPPLDGVRDGSIPADAEAQTRHVSSGDELPARKREHESRAMAKLTQRRQLATHTTREVAADREAEPRPRLLAR